MRGSLHCYYKDIYGIRPVERKLRNTAVWLSCGFYRPPSRDAANRFLTDLEHVVDEIFNRPDLLCRFDRHESDASRPRCVKAYDPTEDEYCYGYGCTIVSTGQKIPIAAEFTESKQAPEEMAMRVT